MDSNTGSGNFAASVVTQTVIAIGNQQTSSDWIGSGAGFTAAPTDQASGATGPSLLVSHSSDAITTVPSGSDAVI